MPPVKLHKLHLLGATHSTNSEAIRHAEAGEPVGTVVWAETQSAGKGSHSRRWHSPKGGLYLSVILSAATGRNPTDLSFLGAVAVYQTLRTTLPKSFDVSVKWPNDCLIDSKKVSGILSEVVPGTQPNLCVVGIGINANMGESEFLPFKDNPFAPTSLSILLNSKIELTELKDTLLTKLWGLCEIYESEGFGVIQYLWEQSCQMIGKIIEIEDAGEVGREPTRGPVIGIMEGIDSTGALVISSTKERRRFISGRITRCSSL